MFGSMFSLLLKNLCTAMQLFTHRSSCFEQTTPGNTQPAVAHFYMWSPMGQRPVELRAPAERRLVLKQQAFM